MILNRQIGPRLQPVTFKSIQEAELFWLENGIPVYVINAGSEELMRAEFIFDGGQVNEDFPLLASTTNAMLLEGSKNYSAKEINNAFDFYGAFVNPFINKDSAGMTVYFLNKHIEKIIELCSEVLLNPLFPENELVTLQRKRLQSYQVNRKKVQNLSSDRYFEAVFGPDHPYGRQVSQPDFMNVTTAMLQAFHRRYYSHGIMTVIISGKVPENAKGLLRKYLGDHQIEKESEEKNNPAIIGSKKLKDFVAKKGAIQSAIRIGSATINKNHNDYLGLMVLDTILGGYFGSRLMKNIREEKGYTYGISSSLISLKQSGYKIIATEVGQKHTEKTIEEIYKEIRILQSDPVGKEELETVRNYMLGEMVRMFDGPFALAESFKAAWEFGLDNRYYYNMEKKIKTITPDEIIALANTYYNIAELYEIIAGAK
jgi:zinc protease